MFRYKGGIKNRAGMPEQQNEEPTQPKDRTDQQSIQTIFDAQAENRRQNDQKKHQEVSYSPVNQHSFSLILNQIDIFDQIGRRRYQDINQEVV